MLTCWTANRSRLSLPLPLPSRHVEWTKWIGQDAASTADKLERQTRRGPDGQLFRPSLFKIHVSRNRKAWRMDKIQMIKIKVILAKSREKERQPAAL